MTVIPFLRKVRWPQVDLSRTREPLAQVFFARRRRQFTVIMTSNALPPCLFASDGPSQRHS